MQNPTASNTTWDELALLMDMGFPEQQSREVQYMKKNLFKSNIFFSRHYVE